MKQFDLKEGIKILSRTPSVLKQLLHALPSEWVFNNEGNNTWSPYDIVGHLIHGEKTDWMIRTKIILSENTNKTFEPFDRYAQMDRDAITSSISDLLNEFESLRKQNLEDLSLLDIERDKLMMTGYHPELGEVSLQELLSTWVVHDLGHIAQIARVMAKQWRDEVGPWEQYLGILHN